MRHHLILSTFHYSIRQPGAREKVGEACVWSAVSIPGRAVSPSPERYTNPNPNPNSNHIPNPNPNPNPKPDPNQRALSAVHERHELGAGGPVASR